MVTWILVSLPVVIGLTIWAASLYQEDEGATEAAAEGGGRVGCGCQIQWIFTKSSTAANARSPVTTAASSRSAVATANASA